MKVLIPTILMLIFCDVQAQKKTLDPFSLNRDSLIDALLKKVPEDVRKDFEKIISEDTVIGKDLVLFKLLTPRSSKKEMIANIDSNYENIKTLNQVFQQLVPLGYSVYIEWNAADPFFREEDTYDIFISTDSKSKPPRKYWDRKLESEIFQSLLKELKWDSSTIMRILQLLNNAHCISIESGKIPTIGFARNEMGKYSFKLFPRDLTQAEQSEYTNKCSSQFYKKNIVLEYSGGSAGPQCFPDKN